MTRLQRRLPRRPCGRARQRAPGFTYTYVATESLHFYLMGEVGQDVTLEVWVGGDLILDFDRDWILPADQWAWWSWIWDDGIRGVSDVDFSWHYVGAEAPAIYLDTVWIDEIPVGSERSSLGVLKANYR